MPTQLNISAEEKLALLIKMSSDKKALKKAVFSKPSHPHIVRAVATLRSVGGKPALQIECFTKDNKALHRNIFVHPRIFGTKYAKPLPILCR